MIKKCIFRFLVLTFLNLTIASDLTFAHSDSNEALKTGGIVVGGILGIFGIAYLISKIKSSKKPKYPLKKDEKSDKSERLSFKYKNKLITPSGNGVAFQW